MITIDPGHCYTVQNYDGVGNQTIRFLKREGYGYPGNVGNYAGTNCQEVLRVLIDRVKYLHNQIPHEQNGVILDGLRSALAAFEVRASKRHGLSFNPSKTIEYESTCETCGHINCEHVNA